MSNITIISEDERPDSWEFKVDVDGMNFTVDLDNDYYQKLTEGHMSPRDLIIKSFRFLLDREPKESILKKFNLKDINKYFSEYEEIIGR